MGYRKQARSPRYCFLHCSATPPKMNCTSAMIDSWHKGQGWPGIAYAWFCRQNGKWEKGAPENVIAYHAGGNWNVDSFGICYEGGVNNAGVPADTRTEAQKIALLEKCRDILARYPDIKFIGHNAVAQKACPSFDWRKWCKENDLPIFDPKAPKKSITASILSGSAAVAGNEFTENRIGLLDGFDFQTSIAPVTDLLTGVVGSKVPAWFSISARIGLGMIAIATAYFAINRTLAQVQAWRERRNNPRPATPDEMQSPGA